MSSSKLSRWAAASGGKILTSPRTNPAPQPSPQQTAPVPTHAHNWPWPQPAIAPTTPQQPPRFTPGALVTPTGHAHPRQLWRPAGGAVPETCRIVKADAVDPYAEFLAGLPDLSGGVDLSEGFNAMSLPSVPEGAVMAHWTPSAKRTLGGRDCDESNMDLPTYTQRRYGAGSFRGGLNVTGGTGTFTKPSKG